MQACANCGERLEADAAFCLSCGLRLRPAVDPLLGRTLGGRYALRARIGQGGMGRVYLADQAALGRPVAVKVLAPHLTVEEGQVLRFYREARASARLDHANTVRVLDFGQSEDGLLYLVMEYIAGRGLDAVLVEDGPLRTAEALEVAVEICEALASAHAAGIVHRDVKPDNVMLGRTETGRRLVKVVDFGLALLRSDTRTTNPDDLFGTPEYMSPEHIESSAAVDARADLYSLGAVLFEMLTGHPPFRGAAFHEVLLAHLHEPAPDLRDHLPDAPAALAELCLRALAKSPDDRYRSADEMAAALRACLAELEAQAPARRCLHCGARLRGDPYCGACGGPVTESLTPPSPSGELAFPQRDEPRVPFVGREPLVDHLAAAVADPHAPAFLHIVGPPGEGKSRLLFEVAERARDAGHLVLSASPHPLDAPAPYHVTRELLCRALGVDRDEMRRWLGEGRSFGSALVHAGISGVLTASGVHGVPWGDRVGAACAALEAALGDLSEAQGGARVALLVDDLDRCDGLSVQVLVELAARASFPGVVLTAGRSAGPPRARTLTLAPLGSDDLERLCAHLHLAREAKTVAAHAGTEVGRPLYVSQLARSRSARAALAAGAPPARQNDLVATRITAMQPEVRAVLFAAAVLGDRFRRDDLFTLHGEEIGPCVDALRAGGVLRLSHEHVGFAHPLLREVALAIAPPERLRELHARAVGLSLARGGELAERAIHAYAADEPAALLWLDRLGFEAAQRGDPETAVFAYGRAVDLARRHAFRFGDEASLHATRLLQRCLAEALRRGGDLRAAEGVLREARAQVGPEEPEHLELGCLLALVLTDAGRLDDARALLDALSSARDASRRAPLWTARAALARAEGAPIRAAEASRMALACHVADGADDGTRVRALLELADDLLAVGDEPAARAALEQASGRCIDTEHPALASQVLGRLGRLARRSGLPAAASDLYREAARLAAEGGDAPQHRSWRCEADELSQAG